MRSIQELTLIFSLDFIILRASSSKTSPVNVSSITSITRSAKGNLRREESFCMLTRPRKASSITMQPRSAYEMLSFQNERYPYPYFSSHACWSSSSFRTCLSLSPMRIISSISVNFGCLLLSALSLISRGSYAILWPFSEFSQAVSGARSSRLGAGELTLLPSSSSLPVAPAPPLLLVSPELEAIGSGGAGGDVVAWIPGIGTLEPRTHVFRRLSDGCDTGKGGARSEEVERGRLRGACVLTKWLRVFAWLVSTICQDNH